jgi:hypothetical protein
MRVVACMLEEYTVLGWCMCALSVAFSVDNRQVRLGAAIVLLLFE